MEEQNKIKVEEIDFDKDYKINNNSITLKIFVFFENIGLWILDHIFLKSLANFYKDHIEGMRYLVCGALATIVNLIAKYALLFTILDASNAGELQTAVIISWVVACIFAYVTNRAIVFQSKSDKIIKEFTSFCGARIFTLGLEMIIMFVFVTWMKLDSDAWVVLWTIVAQIVVIVVNYVFSKLFIFKENNKVKEEK